VKKLNATASVPVADIHVPYGTNPNKFLADIYGDLFKKYNPEHGLSAVLLHGTRTIKVEKW
jgi:hypothetical protein